MSLEELSAMFDPETMDFDEFVRQYKPDSSHLRHIQDVEYEQSLAQDQAKQKIKEIKEVQRIEPEEREDLKPTLAELRQLRIAKLSPSIVLPKPDYTKCTLVELKKQCKERGLKGYTNKCKQELMDLLK